MRPEHTPPLQEVYSGCNRGFLSNTFSVYSIIREKWFVLCWNFLGMLVLGGISPGLGARAGTSSCSAPRISKGEESENPLVDHSEQENKQMPLR